MAEGNERQNLEIKKGRGGGQPKPRTPSGKRETWTPPRNGTTPADRSKDK